MDEVRCPVLAAAQEDTVRFCVFLYEASFMECAELNSNIRQTGVKSKAAIAALA